MILWLKVLTATIEVLLGIGLVCLAVMDISVGTWVRHLALRELRDDPSDFISRHLLLTVPALSQTREFILGSFAAVYGLLKGSVVLAVLRHHRRAAIAGTALFTVIAVATLVVLMRDPTFPRGILGVLDIAVAVVMWREALSLRHHAVT